MLTIAYVGFGVSVRAYHIPYVEMREDIRVKYVFRREEDIAQYAEYEPFYPEIRFITDFETILKDPEVDLVVVSAPDAFHVSYAKQILNAGKHALIEKPFAPTAAEAREVFALAKEKGLICMPNQNRRFDADFLALKEVLASGKIGELVRLESHYDYFRPNGWYDHLGTTVRGRTAAIIFRAPRRRACRSARMYIPTRSMKRKRSKKPSWPLRC